MAESGGGRAGAAAGGSGGDDARARASSSVALAGGATAEAMSALSTEELPPMEIPVVEGYFDRVQQLLWPRFKVIFDANLNSMKVASPAKLKPIDLGVHFTTNRFAEFFSSILVLHRSMSQIGISDSMLTANVAMLRSEWEKLLGGLAQTGHAAVKARYAFLVNNYHFCFTVGRARKVDETDLAHFVEMRNTNIANVVEAEIAEYFPRLRDFNKRNDVPEGAAPPRIDAREVEEQVHNFNTNWQAAVGRIHQTLMRTFPDRELLKEIINRTFVQLIVEHRAFITIVNRTFATRLTVMRDLISERTLLEELGRFVLEPAAGAADGAAGGGGGSGAGAGGPGTPPSGPIRGR